MHLLCAPNYKNETLAQVLELACADAYGPTHRALADATITAELLIELLDRYTAEGRPPTVEDLVGMIARPARLRRLTFGRHKGTPISQVPSDYLEWILSVEPPMWPDVTHSAELELARRTATATA
jgi:exodeoxyribonuclease X